MRDDVRAVTPAAAGYVFPVLDYELISDDRAHATPDAFVQRVLDHELMG